MTTAAGVSRPDPSADLAEHVAMLAEAEDVEALETRAQARARSLHAWKRSD